MRNKNGSELSQRGGVVGARFYLDDVRVRHGEALELATFGGGWVIGRFMPERRPLRPVLYVSLFNGAQVHFVLPEGARLRRPSSLGAVLEIGPDGPR